MLSELHEVELNLFPVVASMTGPAESEADGLVPESVNGTFKSIILIKEPVPLGEVLVAGQDDASCLFETDAVYQLEEEKSLLPVELAVAELILMRQEYLEIPFKREELLDTQQEEEAHRSGRASCTVFRHLLEVTRLASVYNFCTCRDK